MLRTTLLFGLCILLSACSSAPRAQNAPAGAPPLFSGLGNHHRAITTKSPEAQRYFDQGLTLAYSFNHDEAIRSFREAARLDPTCAMAWWGIALCNGPHINNPSMSEQNSIDAWEALGKAQDLAWTGTAAEQALIGALGARYAWPIPGNRAWLDTNYALAMRVARQQFALDADIATLYAEALMDLRPWDLYDIDGTPRPETPIIIATLETALALDPNHPGANHLYIHAVEASDEPERGLPSADLLCTLLPATGHMVHMPAHIYARTGRWSQASEQNRRALRADVLYRKLSPNQGFYNIYMAHNHQFLSFSCMMQGRSREAISSARAMVDGIPPEFIEQSGPLIDGVLSLPLSALLRFGKWEQILEEPQPPAELPIWTTMWHFARAIALANTGRLDEAAAEQEIFLASAAAIPPGSFVGNSDAGIVITIATHVLAGELAFKSGDIDSAIEHLVLAVAAEDTLRYNEPPDWSQPVRHTLGAFLLSAGRPEEAEVVYLEDLQKWPENGWSLLGLAQSLEAQGDPMAGEINTRFLQSWSQADSPIKTTCLCVPPSGG